MPSLKLYRTEVAVITADSSIEEAAKLMRDFRVGSIVVIESTTDGSFFPVGLLTDRDIVVDVVAEGQESRKLLVAQIMSPHPITVNYSATLEEMLTLMKDFNVRRLPVVDDKRNLVGFVSFDDLLERVGAELSFLSQLSNGQNRLEKVITPVRDNRFS
ncbi:MAG: CBS domain-containing protein [Proteobacteria bacterium]|nr:CBS domain-containing protein [Pseudomonadota bacterium]NDC23570.1 CBS domain-containing protein [Pseudomonadota bacterium]NDD04387.1 CBS domain-containing protein [Pseudomonadota bacterium]NDG25598.1 CBS domain-containing protein [Pseudomonadota bacterium]